MRPNISAILLACAAFGVSSWAQQTPPPQPPVTFKVEVNYVEIDANVTDAQGTFMRTLKNLADFMAGMRGRRKAVVFFSEGVNYNVTDPFNNPHATDVQREIRD